MSQRTRPLHIIAPNMQIAQNFARRNGKFPHHVRGWEQIAGLPRGTTIYFILGDRISGFDMTPKQEEDNNKLYLHCRASGYDLQLVAMEHQIES